MSPELGQTLLTVARQAIAARLDERPFSPALEDYPQALEPVLAEPAACFVSLHQLSDHALRGCIGCLEATQSLLDCVAEHAVACAFYDPRFPALRAEECPQLELEVSVLSPGEPIPADTEQILLEQLTPGVHGLILSQGKRRATFLPQVWDSLPEKSAFLSALLHKGGWLSWPEEEMQAWRYTVSHISGPLTEPDAR